jgi:hypothetical protein
MSLSLYDSGMSGVGMDQVFFFIITLLMYNV